METQKLEVFPQLLLASVTSSPWDWFPECCGVAGGAVWMLCCADSHALPQLRNRSLLSLIKCRLEESLVLPCSFLEMGFSPEIIQLQVKGPRRI